MIDFHQVGVDYGRVPTSVDIPLLQYLLKCGHLARKPDVNSNYDIYTKEEVLKCVFVFLFVFVCMYVIAFVSTLDIYIPTRWPQECVTCRNSSVFHKPV